MMHGQKNIKLLRKKFIYGLFHDAHGSSELTAAVWTKYEHHWQV